MFGPQLHAIVDIRGVHDLHGFLRDCRPRSADRNVRMQYAFTFEARDTEIYVRSKKHCGADTPWGPWAQILPFPGTNVAHEPEESPAMAAPKPWPELEEEIAPSLTKFYERRFPHPVTIPQSDLDAMRSFEFTHFVHPACLLHKFILMSIASTSLIGDILRGELPPQVAPDWIDWNVDTEAVSETEEEASSSEEDPFDDDDKWQPFLQPRRKRARMAALAESEEEEDDMELESNQGDATDEPFPYPVGTRVARDFGEHGIYWGVIEKHYPDDNKLCLVRFTDGDSEDLDPDQIQYAIGLYEQKFGVGEGSE